MKSKLFLGFLIFLFLAFAVSGQLGEIIGNNEIVIPYGENATAQLPMFSKTYLRIPEGSKVEFDVVDPDNSAILIENNIIIKNVNRTSVDVLLSTDASDYKEVTLYARQPYQINYTYIFTPDMTVELQINHYDEDPTKRNVVLYFLITSFKTRKTDFSQIKSRTIDFDQVNPGVAVDTSVNDSNETINNLLKWILIAIGVIILLIIIISRKKSFLSD